MSPKPLIGVCFVHNAYNRNMLKKDIKSNKGSSKESAEIASGSAIITIYVIQIPSEGSKLAERAYNQNFYFWLSKENDSIFVCNSVRPVLRSLRPSSAFKPKKIPLSYLKLNGILRLFGCSFI
jgi:hypothetical protein